MTTFFVPASFTILGSGSSGNCAYLETDDTRILIDAGLSGRQIRNRLAEIGRSPETLTGILVTHEHTDHTQGLAAIAAKLGVAVYCNRLTKEAIETQIKVPVEFHLFGTGATFEVGEITVDSFSVPHDAYDPVNFLLRTAHGNIGILTDLGHATRLVVERIRNANVLLLEANHDVKMLQQDTRRPWSVKQRILSRHGHLSNDAAASVAAEVVTNGLTHIFLGHLSRDCNSIELARSAVESKLKSFGADHVNVEVAAQGTRSSTLDIFKRESSLC